MTTTAVLDAKTGGEITEAPIVEQEASQRAHLRPYADLRDLDLVQVLTGGSRG